MATSHMAEQVGRVVGGRYRLLAPLGSGASAEVYLADDVRLRRRVAVKILHAGLADDEAFLRRFRSEARAAAALSHPNILAIFDWNGDEAPPYLVTEYLSGGSLRSLLDTGARLSPSQALMVGLETAQALDHAHRQGFVHRDIKPANLLFGGDTRLRIADFGLARAVAEAGWTEPTGAVLGTARYASPEQARGEPLDGRSDVYSLALLLIEAVTGEVPFTADTTIGTLMARIDNPLEVPDELGPLVPILQDAGAPTPSDRPDAATLVRQLVSAASELPRPTPLPLAGTGAPRSIDPGASGEGRDATIIHGSGDDVPTTTPLPDPDTTQRFAPPSDLPPPPLPPHLQPSSPQHLSAAAPPQTIWRNWAFRGLAAVLAVAVGVLGAWFFMQASKPSHTVPQGLIGATVAEMNAQVGDYGWRIDVQEEASEEVEAGRVIRTDPAPGRKLREGERLRVFVSSGPPLVDVPASDTLAGTTQEEAEGILGAPGIELRAEFVPTPSNEVDEDLVIGLEEGTPAQLPRGSTVRVLVASGPAVTVPDVVGWEWRDARRELRDQDLEVNVEREASDEFEDGQVIRTDPAAGTEVAEDSEVTVYVAGEGDDDDGEGGGNTVQVPSVTGLSLDEATDVLEDEGLTVGAVVGSGDGTVQWSTPLAGAEVDEGSSVDLYMF